MTTAIVVSGLPRSGTSWVGKMIEAAGRHVYVNEPLNPSHPPGRSPGVLDADVEHYFQYICADNSSLWHAAFERTLGLKYGVRAELRRNRGAYDLARAGRYMTSFTIGKITRRHALLDDPYAIFAIPWLIDQFDLSAVIMVREPVAFVGSWRSLGWQVDTAELLAQPLLMRDLLEPYRGDLARVAGTTDWLASASALWRATYASLHRYAEHPRVHLVRHESLATQPMEGFASMYADLGIPWTRRAEKRIHRATSGSVSSGREPFRWNLSAGLSRTAYRPMSSGSSLGTYQHRLTEDEIGRVRKLTDDVRALYYPDVDGEGSTP